MVINLNAVQSGTFVCSSPATLYHVIETVRAADWCVGHFANDLVCATKGCQPKLTRRGWARGCTQGRRHGDVCDRLGGCAY
jgi:hypothetical protein